MKRTLAFILTFALVLTLAVPACAEILVGEAEGFGGKITAEVTVADGKIVGLELTGEKETPSLGGAALEPLKEAILAAGTVEGVDSVSGATWTSKGVFEAVRTALGQGSEQAEEEAGAVEAAGLYQGLGVVSNGRLGPGKDDTGTGVYSFNNVVAYVLFDGEGRIVDLEVDILEVATPNYDGESMPHLTGFPGQSYNADLDHNETAETVLEQTEDSFLAEVAGWATKRERGNGYKLNSDTWAGEMDTFEKTFQGMTMDEVNAWVAKYCSDLNGRPLHGTSTKDADVAKWDALTDSEKAEMDAISSATMSLTDGHGNILAAIQKAYDNRKSVSADSVAKVGLGITSVGRLGPGKDDTGTGVYSFNTQAVGVCLDENGKVVAMLCDILEVATPNYDGESMPHLTGFPGQSYNADLDHNETAEAVLEQTEEAFLAEVEGWDTKRDRGSSYKLNSGTWTQEMEIFEDVFCGMNAEEIQNWVVKFCSDLNGRPLHGTSTKDADVAKWDALTDSEKAEMDAISGATMSLTDAHGDILGTVIEAISMAKAANITVK